MKNNHLFISILISSLIHLLLILTPLNFSDLYNTAETKAYPKTSSILFELNGNKFVKKELRSKRGITTPGYPNERDLLAEYSIIVEDRIRDNLYIPYTLKTKKIDLSSLVEIDISRDGILIGVTLIKQSGNELIDKLVMSAIKDASPFPPLPENYKKKSLRVALPLRFKVKTKM